MSLGQALGSRCSVVTRPRAFWCFCRSLSYRHEGTCLLTCWLTSLQDPGQVPGANCPPNTPSWSPQSPNIPALSPLFRSLAAGREQMPETWVSWPRSWAQSLNLEGVASCLRSRCGEKLRDKRKGDPCSCLLGSRGATCTVGIWELPSSSTLHTARQGCVTLYGPLAQTQHDRVGDKVWGPDSAGEEGSHALPVPCRFRMTGQG